MKDEEKKTNELAGVGALDAATANLSVFINRGGTWNGIFILQDQEIVHAWLSEMHFEEYYPLFVNAGYDMPTISKMTPEDLTAIGVKKPNHRKKLKAEIAQLNISDGLPEFIPVCFILVCCWMQMTRFWIFQGSMEEWLRLLRLEEYIPTFKEQNYHTVSDVTQLAWEDLEEAGVVKLGHQKRLILAIKRVKDIRAGKRFTHNSSIIIQTQVCLITNSKRTPAFFPSSSKTSFVFFNWEKKYQPWPLAFV